MPYVQRDSNGVITGLFGNPQPGFATEYLPDNDATVVAFLTPAPQTAGIVRQSYLAGLQRQAAALQTKGQTYDAVKLLIKSQGT